MTESVLGTRLPVLTVALVRDSRQVFALRWLPPSGETLDLAVTTISLQFGAMVLDAVTDEDPDVPGAWRSTWTIDEADAQWSFTTAAGRIVATTAADRVVLLAARIEVSP